MDTSRQQEIFIPERISDKVTIIGVGATGSAIAVQLARIGVPKLTLWDFDKIEEHNIPNQMYIGTQKGMNKAKALESILLSINPDIEVNVFDEEYRLTNILQEQGVVFVCTDTMESRKKFVPNLMQKASIIETRMGGKGGDVFFVAQYDNEALEKWEKLSNYDDDNAEESLCGTSISIMPTNQAIASLAVWKFIKLINGEKNSLHTIIDFENTFCIIDSNNETRHLWAGQFNEATESIQRRIASGQQEFPPVPIGVPHGEPMNIPNENQRMADMIRPWIIRDNSRPNVEESNHEFEGECVREAPRPNEEYIGDPERANPERPNEES